MKEFVFSSYRLETDVEGNRACYAGKPLPWVSCDCAGCRNFIQAYPALPKAVFDFFDALGLHPAQPAEICCYERQPEGLSYSSFYHLSGRLLEGDAEPGRRYGEWFPIADGVTAAFSGECDLVPEDFPRPCVQMEIFYHLPWLLDEPNPYCR